MTSIRGFFIACSSQSLKISHLSANFLNEGYITPQRKVLNKLARDEYHVTDRRDQIFFAMCMMPSSASTI